MKTPAVCWFVVPALALTLTGCPKREIDTTTAPPGGPAPGTAPAPPGPGGVSLPGGGTTASGHPTPPAPGSTGNEKLIRSVKNALITHQVMTGKLGVSVNGGAITLSGSVPTASQKALAVATAKQVLGVTSVKDQLTVVRAP